MAAKAAGAAPMVTFLAWQKKNSDLLVCLTVVDMHAIKDYIHDKHNQTEASNISRTETGSQTVHCIKPKFRTTVQRKPKTIEKPQKLAPTIKDPSFEAAKPESLKHVNRKDEDPWPSAVNP